MPNAYHPPVRDVEGVSLPTAARARFGSSTCPCCRRWMTNNTVKRGKPTPPHKSTVGHINPVSQGGNPAVWVYQCALCNSDQGVLPLVVWLRKLHHANDARAAFVIELNSFVEEWLAHALVRRIGVRS